MSTRFPRNARPAPSSGRGIALIEVLVAMLVFSLGVLALVGLQGAMVRAQTDAKVRTDASYLANEVIGKMWADPVNFAQFNDTTCANQTACQEWKNKVAALLPTGVGKVEIDDVVGEDKTKDVTVTITWQLPNGEEHRHETHTTIAKAGA